MAALLLTHTAGLRAASFLPPDFGQLVHTADAVVRAEVVGVESRWERRGGDPAIVTHITLAVREILKGEDLDSHLTLVLLGGTVGPTTFDVPGQVRFVVGDEDFLFVQGNGRQWSPLVAATYGRYPIVEDPTTGRTIVTRANYVPLEATDEVSLPLFGGDTARLLRQLKREGLSPADFARLIREELDRGAAPPPQTP
jgi:hypothetical protein